MRNIILTILIITGLTIALPLNSARFDWSWGEPVVTDDNDNTTHGTRYGWSWGRPVIVREAETAAEAAYQPRPPIIGFSGGGFLFF